MIVESIHVRLFTEFFSGVAPSLRRGLIWSE